MEEEMKRLQDEMQEDVKEESLCCFRWGAGAWGVVGNFGVKGNV